MKTKVALLVILCVAAQGIADDGIIIRENERTLEQIEKNYSEMPPVEYPADCIICHKRDSV